MPGAVLILGPIVFQDFELPPSINFGGGQRLSVHRLPGGVRVIDALGRDDAEITFSGIFSGSDATLRARELDTLRGEGVPLPLTWDLFFYTVIIRCFEADYRSGWWIPYRIACTVVRDEAAALIDMGLSLAASAIADVSSAAGQALSAGIDLSSVQSSLSVPDAATRGSSAFNAAGSAIEAAQTSVQSNIDQAGSGLLRAGAALNTAANAQDGIAAFSGIMQSAPSLGPLANARGYLGRAAANLLNASS